jgi:general secretion pathway protein G
MKNRSGFTLVELMVVLAIIALLLAAVVPDYVGRTTRAEEAVLQENLAVLRDALDKHYAHAGRYPDTLEELVAKRYLRSIPKDPFTQSSASWVPVPPADPKKGGVFDIHSSAKGYERW